MSQPDWRSLDLFAPTPEHALLADTLREFVAREVEPQAAAYNRDERFNLALFRRAGELGLLGLTLPAEYGGAGPRRRRRGAGARGALDRRSGLRALVARARACCS